MPVIAPWLRPTDVLAAMEGGSRLGLAQRAATDQEAAQAASQQSAAQRLKLSYDALAADQAKQDKALAARSQQTAAVDRLRQSQQDALMQYRQQQEQVAQTRLKDQEAARSAADQLKSTQEDANAAFMSDYEQSGDPVKAHEDNPGASAALVGPYLKDYFAQQMQDKREKAATAKANQETETETTIYPAKPGTIQTGGDKAWPWSTPSPIVAATPDVPERRVTRRRMVGGDDSSDSASPDPATPAQALQNAPEVSATFDNVGKTRDTAFKPTSADQVESLPLGAFFVNPSDGKVYRKKAAATPAETQATTQPPTDTGDE